jgi:CubicO group peptidase (beta-lactamase class C family)
MDFRGLELFLDQITAWRIPGADCLVHLHGQPVFRYSAGFADLAARRPVSDRDLYFIYSMSKVITCTAALQLHEQGRFLMTDPVSAYLPEFKDMMVRQTDASDQVTLKKAEKEMTIRDLFTMMAGLTYELNTPAIRAVREHSQGRSPTRDVIRAIAADPLIFEPGTHFNYSLCHDVLGALIEVISGKRFGKYLDESIFQPLGMKDTGFSLTDARKERMATQYNFDDATGKALRVSLANVFVVGSEFESGGAGLISSVDDYMRLADTLCHKGLSRHGERILSSHSVDLMRTNHLDDVSLRDFTWIQMAGYGYGLGVRTMLDRTRSGSLSPVGEFGWAGAAGAYVLMDPEHELTVVYAQHLLNSQEPYVHPRIRNLVYRCLER